jgi:hypothetical protein
MLELAIIIGLVVILDLAAIYFGADSRYDEAYITTN